MKDESSCLERLLLAGAGGQGVILAGRLLVGAAMRHYPHVTFFPSYGAEVRGGLSTCQVVLSSEEIASPVCESFDILVLLRHPETPRFLACRAAGGLVLMDLPSPSSRTDVTALDATAMADDLGDVRAANFVLLGRLLSLRPLVPWTDMEAEIRRFFGAKDPALAERNLRALHRGREAT